MVATTIFVIMFYNKNSNSADRSSVSVTSVVTDAYGRIDINNATLEQLANVDGIGYKLANSIVDYRNSVGTIHDMNELSTISGIGEKKFEALCQKFYVSDDNKISSTTAGTITCVTIQTTTTSVSDSPAEASTVSTATSEVTSTSKKHTTATKVTTEKQRRSVNINTATAEQLADCLLIDIEIAEEIVSCRKTLGGCYTNIYEVLYCEGMSDSLFIELRDYLLI